MLKLTIPEELASLPHIDYRKIVRLQGNLKTLSDRDYKRLKKSFTEKGFFVPFFLWRDKKNKQWLNMDGHQRLDVLEGEEATPHKLPYVEIEADNIKQAAQRLLLITSSYGVITQEGYDKFEERYKIDKQFTQQTTSFAAFAAATNIVPFMTDTTTNQGIGKTPLQQLDGFLNATVKQMVMYVKNSQYDETLAKLEAAGEKHGTDNHAATIRAMIEEYNKS